VSADGDPAPIMFHFSARCEESHWPQEEERLVARVDECLRVHRSKEVILFAAGIPLARLRSLERALCILPSTILVVPDAVTEEWLRHKCAPAGTHIAIEVRREPLSRTQRLVKRLMDICLTSIFIVLLLPAFVLIAVAIKLDSPGPVLFFQTRYGLHGRPFRILKFRTMSVLEDGAVVTQARPNDSRVTRVGRILRKTSADELPQFFNVLAGQMSLVGPRPHARAHDEQYAVAIEHYEIRQYVKPGITGWAQVNGLRGETPTLEHMYRRIEHDLWYAGNASLLLDMEIMVRTLFVILNFQATF